MQKLSLKQTLTQRLTPQQIQLIKLLQVPSIDIKSRIEQELADNPVLEEGYSEDSLLSEKEQSEEELLLDEYDLPSNQSKLQQDKVFHANQVRKESLISMHDSLYEQLLAQLALLKLDNKQHQIGQHLIGSLENDGYIRRDLAAIVNDLSFIAYIETNIEEVSNILKLIQNFDPPGIGARNLQECLLIQLYKKEDSIAKHLAIKILTQAFEAFTKKHYDKLIKKLGIEDKTLLKDSLDLIAKLNPKPGGRGENIAEAQPLYPDFWVTRQHGDLQVGLTAYHTPELRIRKTYTQLLTTYQDHPNKDKSLKEAALFIKKRVESAKWFIDAIKQRKDTLLKTMETIVHMQYDFFMDENKENLRPMILKDVAVKIGMDVSTVSRIVNNKSVQTDVGIYPLKFFFTEGITTITGEEVSNSAVKQVLWLLIQKEDKQHPYADEKLTELMQAEGYRLARRTVAKYREQLGIPIARLRKVV